MKRNRSVVASLIAAVLCAFALYLAADAQKPAPRAERITPPTGAEIAAAARKARLDLTRSGTGQVLGKSVKFTPAATFSRADSAIESGVFLGVMENSAAGDESGLPPGRYNVYVAKVRGVWHAYAESNGVIVREAARAEVSTGGNPSVKPTFFEPGWGASITVKVTWGDTYSVSVTAKVWW